MQKIWYKHEKLEYAVTRHNYYYGCCRRSCRLRRRHRSRRRWGRQKNHITQIMKIHRLECWIMPVLRLRCSASTSTPSATSSHESVIFEIFLFRIFVHLFECYYIFVVLYFAFSVCIHSDMRLCRFCYTIKSNEWIPRKLFWKSMFAKVAASAFGLTVVCICTNFHRIFSVFVLRGCKQPVAQRPYISFFVSCFSSLTYTIHKSTHRVHGTDAAWIMYEIRMCSMTFIQFVENVTIWANWIHLNEFDVNMGLLTLSHICFVMNSCAILIELTQTHSPAVAAHSSSFSETERNWVYSPNALPSQQSDDYSSLSS